MFKYILKRLGLMLVTLWFIVSITFISMALMPGNPYNNEKLTKEDIAVLDHENGFDKPVLEQYTNYLANMAQGDMGKSFVYKDKVSNIISKRYPVSFHLGMISVIVGTIIGILLGMVAALRRNTWADYLATVIAVIGVSFPSFVVAAYLQYYLALKLGLFPVSYIAGGPIERMVLPIIALSVFAVAQVARVTRTEMVEVSEANYVNLARAKGVSKRNVNFKHVFRNTLISILTVLGPLTVSLTTGSLVVERIFGIPGIGDVLVGGVLGKDIFLVTGVTLFISLQILLMYLLVDVLYAVVDPRIRVSGGNK